MIMCQEKYYDEEGSSHQIIDIIKDMYDEVATNVRTCEGLPSDFFDHNWIALRICIESILICHSDG